MKPLFEPMTPWEEDLFPVFDRLKAAMDRQEEARVAGKLDQFVSAASFLFKNLEWLTWNAWCWDNIQAEWVYLTWKRSRGIDQWVPDRDLPLRWTLAERAMVPLPPAEAMAKIKEKHARFAQSCKDAAKQMKQEHRKTQRDLKKAAKRKEAKP